MNKTESRKRTLKRFCRKAEALKSESIDEATFRKCLVSGEHYPRERMVRFALDSEGVLTPDLEEKLGGKGLWVLADKGIIAKISQSKKNFTRVVRRQVIIPDDLTERLDMLLMHRCKSLLSLLKKSGKLVSGFAKANQVIKEGKSKILLFASDGAKASLEKLEDSQRLEIFSDFSGQELEDALGVSPCVFVALFSCPLEQTLIDNLLRLRWFRHSGVEQNC